MAKESAARSDLEDDDDRWDVQEPLLFLFSWKVGEAAAAAAAVEEPERPEVGWTGLYIVSECKCMLYQGSGIGAATSMGARSDSCRSEQGNSSMCGLGESAPVSDSVVTSVTCMCLSLSCMFYYEEEMQGQAAGGRQSNRGNISGGGEVLRENAHGAVGRSFDRRRLKKRTWI